MTKIISCEFPECLELAIVRIVVGHSGLPAKASCLCGQHLFVGLEQVGYLATETIGSNNHVQVLVFPLS